jgi:hypothetical protein
VSDLAAPDPAAADLDEPDGTEGSTPPGRRRQLPRIVVAAVVAVGLVLVLVATSVWWDDGADGPAQQGAEAADAFVEAYTRNVDGTFLVEGELTRTMGDGRTLGSAYLVVQRPPDHLQRSFGSTTGAVNGRTVNCTTPEGARYTCGPGAAESWDEERATVLGALDSYVRGDDPVYEVTVDDSGCYELVRRRTETDASFGQRARLCFDEPTGAIRRLEVHHDGGATDVMLATRITSQVSDADFDLEADDTYDPQVPDSSGTVPTTS